MKKVIITEICGFQSSGYISGRANTVSSIGHNPFTWHWIEGNITVLFDGYRKPNVTKEQAKTWIKSQLITEKYLIL